MDRIRIAREILGIAKDLLPRIKITFTRTPKVEEREFHSAHFDIQRFVSTLRGNENLECFVSRRDDDKVMEITVGFTDHEAMKGIVESMSEMVRKLGKKSGLKVVVEVPDTSDKK
jgi:hypothetical protein